MRTTIILALLFAIIAVAFGIGFQRTTTTTRRTTTTTKKPTTTTTKKPTTTTTTKKPTTTTTTKKPTTTTTKKPTTTTTKKPTTTTTTKSSNNDVWNFDNWGWGDGDDDSSFVKSARFTMWTSLNKMCASSNSNSNNLLSGLTSQFCTRWTSFFGQWQTLVEQEFAKYGCALPSFWSQLVATS